LLWSCRVSGTGNTSIADSHVCFYFLDEPLSLSKTRAVAPVGSHCYFSVAAEGTIWLCWSTNIINLLLKYYCWIAHAVSATGSIDCIEVLNCLILN
jgi:hypothetical protein